MKFSEALRSGSVKLHPMKFSLCSVDGTCGCALGMALVGKGYTADQILNKAQADLDVDGYRFIVQEWPWLETPIENPRYGIRGREPAPVWQVITSLSDGWLCTGVWTMDQLVAWVEEQEAKYA